MTMKQNDAVFAAACQVLGATSFDFAVKPDTQQRKEIVELVARGIYEGTVAFSDKARAEHDTYEKIKSYTVGMVSNHLRKDKRLNGDVKYEIQKPGSRAGQGDVELKNLKALRSQLTDKEQIEAVDEAIAAREEIVKQTKTKTVTIDINSIPESLRHLVKVS